MAFDFEMENVLFWKFAFDKIARKAHKSVFMSLMLLLQRTAKLVDQIIVFNVHQVWQQQVWRKLSGNTREIHSFNAGM